MTTIENVSFPDELLGDALAVQKARDLLARLGLAERADNLPSQLSGGEKQRVALCRPVNNRPGRIAFFAQIAKQNKWVRDWDDRCFKRNLLTFTEIAVKCTLIFKGLPSIRGRFLF